MKKNTADQDWIVFAFDRTDNTAKTGDALNITAKISKDGAAGVGTDDANPTELESGYYVFDLTQAETNADVLSIIPVSATADIQVIGVPGTVYTDASVDQTGDSYAIVNGDHGLVSIQDDIDAILLDTDELQTDWTNGGRLDLILDELTTQGDTNETKLDTIDTVVDAIKVKTDNLPGAVPKGVALADFAFVMYSSQDHVTPLTGLSPSGYISKDGGAFAELDGTIAAIASGVYQVDSITATEMDADLIVLRFTATNADDVVVVIKTDE